MAQNTVLIEAVKLRQLLASARTGIVISTLLAFTLAYWQRGLIVDRILVVWLVAVIVAAVWRVVWIAMTQAKFSEHDSELIRAQLIQFRVLTATAGLVWGLAGYFLLPIGDAEHAVLLLYLLAGLSAAGIVSYSIDFISASLYATFILFPISISLLLVESEFSLTMSVLVWVFLGFLIWSLRNINSESIDNVVLRIDGNEKDSFIKAVEERYHLLLDCLPMGVFHFNKENEVTFSNQQLRDILKGSEGLSEGDDLRSLGTPGIQKALQSSLDDAEINRFEGVYEPAVDDEEQWVSMICAPVNHTVDNVTEGIAIVQDVTEQKKAAKLIEKLALQDYLTELPNRRLLIDKMQQALESSLDKQTDVGLMYIDLDNFKELNDSFGHAVGDLLLQQVAKRLSECLRHNDMVARASRIGGDEFVILLENLSATNAVAHSHVEGVAENVMTQLNKPFKLAGHDYQCSVSIGVVLYNANKGSVDDLLKYADIAMYEAKKVGNAVRFYDAKMLENINQREDMKRALMDAIKNDEFLLYYQIQVDTAQKPIGAEALVRWDRPGHGLVPPFSFIPLAEETGLIVPLGIWVMRQACRQLSAWAKNPKLRGLDIAINVSTKQLLDPSFAEEVEKSIKEYNVNPALLKIELTESMFLDNASGVIDTMHALQKLGLGFELDDFGTGYSCLQYLKQLPLTKLKIDKSFVRDINDDKSDQSIVKTIIAMAHGFNIDVIAEGVETKEQYLLLSSYGCEHFQGYYFGKPTPVDVFEAALGAYQAS